MAVCNILKDSLQSTGNFILFSQYMEDLARFTAEGQAYRVAPSKFVAMDIDYSSFNSILKTEITTQLESSGYTDINMDQIMLTYLQDHFENGCSYVKNHLSSDEQWAPELSSNLFWTAMYNADLLNVQQETPYSGTSTDVAAAIKYIGDIDIQSYDTVDGFGFSEVFCFVPESARSAWYQFFEDSEADTFKTDSSDVIEGWYGQEQREGICPFGIDRIKPIRYRYDHKYWIGGIDGDQVSVFAENPVPVQFQINTLVVLYDVYNEDGTVIHQNIPMGIYLPSNFDGGTMQNAITKFVSNDDIYGTGTSYGLRLCTHYVSAPGSDLIYTSFAVQGDDDLINTAEILSQMSETLEKVQEASAVTAKSIQLNKEMYALFKNSRTNVPYTKDINGIPYWYVNGRSLGIKASGQPGQRGPQGESGVYLGSIAPSNPEIKVWINSEGEPLIPSIPIKLQNTASATINPNMYNIWGSPMEELVVTLASPLDASIVNQYVIDFTSGTSTVFNIVPSSGTIVWNTPLSIQPDKRYQITIIDNLASWREFSI